MSCQLPRSPNKYLTELVKRADMLMILIGATIVIAIAVAAVKLRKKTVNILNIH
jgi:hypothetical protein